jgi:hypothetical protein
LHFTCFSPFFSFSFFFFSFTPFFLASKRNEGPFFGEEDMQALQDGAEERGAIQHVHEGSEAQAAAGLPLGGRTVPLCRVLRQHEQQLWDEDMVRGVGRGCGGFGK